MIDLSIVESELRGRYPKRDIRILANPDEVMVMDSEGVAARIPGEAIYATPKNQLVEMFRYELEVADQDKRTAHATTKAGAL